MTIRDALGLPSSGAGSQSLGHYERALHQLQCFIGDPVASVNAALEADPGFVMAHVLKGYLYGLGNGTRRDGRGESLPCRGRFAARNRARRPVMSRRWGDWPAGVGMRPDGYSRT